MIMAAGLGTRLLPLTDPLPKPMMPVLNTPVMEYSIRLLQMHGVSDIVANTHYNPAYIMDHFGNGSDFGVNLTYSFEEQLLGTAGGVRNNRHFLNETFFVLSGDALTDINLTAMYEFHKKSNSLVTIALKAVRDVSGYGVVVTRKSGRITGFQEKPNKKDALSNVVNTGIYIIEPEIFELIPEGFYDFGRQLFPRLLELGIPFYGYITKDYWCDIGTIPVYKKAHEEAFKSLTLTSFAQKNTLFKLKEHCLTGLNTTLDLSVDLGKNVFIGRNCFIAGDARLNNCIIWDNCNIGENVVINNAIISSNCLIGSNTVIRGGSVIGCNSVIGRDMLLDKGCIIESNSVVVSGDTVSA